MRYSDIHSLTVRGNTASRLQGAAAACAVAIGVWFFPVAAKAQERKNDSWRALDHSSLVAASSTGSGALADFDGDQRPDLAFAEPRGLVNGAYRYRVDVHLSAELSTTFDVDSRASGGLHISARDVDGDHALDLVITSEFGREPIGIWINNGRGAFTKGRPEAYVGTIWQETDRSFQTPRLPGRTAVAIGFPAGSWMTEPARLAVSILANGLRSAATADQCAPSRLYLGSPFRAPPTL
jgi:hypothetical protein